MDLRRRLEEQQSKPPLRATGARRVGAVMSLHGPLQDEDDPVLFWRGTQLCVRQEASKPPRMRCVETATGSWGKEEPYRSPFGGWHVELEYQGSLGYFRTKVITTGPEGGLKVLQDAYEDWSEPVVVARGKGPRLAVVSASDPLTNSRKDMKPFAIRSFVATVLLCSAFAGAEAPKPAAPASPISVPKEWTEYPFKEGGIRVALPGEPDVVKFSTDRIASTIIVSSILLVLL
jgi:hypothetical protein